MLDTSTSSLTPSCDPDWHDSLFYGDILKFRFPGPGQPAAARPATQARGHTLARGASLSLEQLTGCL
ncbi:hypothetical protein ACEWPM_017780 [Roseovarius sp. S4756]|uniref:hypothetical protein n=1 Tax=Roseovarius maritimus TaxID=3342637 RepID=UPI003B67193B